MKIRRPAQPDRYGQIGSVAMLDSQRGASLMVTLIFLIILTMLGLTAMHVATMEERMAGNSRDRSLAFQAAEAALRDAEFDIDDRKADGTPRGTNRISGMTGANAACTNGLCCNVNGLTCIEPSTPVYLSKNLKASPSVAYGTYTDTSPSILATAFSNLSFKPRYLIEPFVVDGKSYYRITARGYGVNPDTQITLQEIYYKE